MRQTGQPEREWMDLKDLTAYSAFSRRTLQELIHRSDDPLPAVRVGTKILVSRSEFDRYLERHPLVPAESVDIDGIVKDVLMEL